MMAFKPAEFLVVATTGMVAGLIAASYAWESKNSNALSQVITAWTLIVGYYFGSSTGSAEKTRIIAGKQDDEK